MGPKGFPPGVKGEVVPYEPELWLSLTVTGIGHSSDALWSCQLKTDSLRI